jgi:hypothetical protein
MHKADDHPVSFLTLEPGTAVVDRFGKRFVDAPEVRRISGGAVTLGVTVADARHGRTQVTEADRDEAIDCLERAYASATQPRLSTNSTTPWQTSA